MFKKHEYDVISKSILYTVKLGDKEQIGDKESFPVTNCQFTS